VEDFGEANYEEPASEPAIMVKVDRLIIALYPGQKTSYESGKQHITVILGDSSTENWDIVIVKLSIVY